MNLNDQLLHFDRHAEKAYVRSLKDFKVYKEDIIAAARQRLIDGYDVFGDSGFRKSHDELRREELEEMADAICYRLMRMRQGWPS